MKQTVTLAAAVTILVLSGVVHGLMADRWGLPDRVIKAADRVSNVPSTIGDWSSQDVEVSSETKKVAGAQAILSRIYTHRPTGSAINILIVCGRPGPVSEHPPTICFTSAGFNLTQIQQKHIVTDQNKEEIGEFWMGDFTKTSGLVPESMRTFWGWSSNGTWEASDNPRLQYAPSAYLYKLYVSRALIRTGEPVNDNDLAIQFMRMLLPELKRTLFDAGQHQTETPTSQDPSSTTQE
ncbi:MAG: exosortase-associated EpsI family protein [Planctomycetaceae bacterium]